MQTLKFALPDWLEPEKAVKDITVEHARICEYDLELWMCDTVKRDGCYNYIAKSSDVLSLFYLGMAVSRILE